MYCKVYRTQHQYLQRLVLTTPVLRDAVLLLNQKGAVVVCVCSVFLPPPEGTLHRRVLEQNVRLQSRSMLWQSLVSLVYK